MWTDIKFILPSFLRPRTKTFLKYIPLQILGVSDDAVVVYAAIGGVLHRGRWNVRASNKAVSTDHGLQQSLQGEEVIRQLFGTDGLHVGEKWEPAWLCCVWKKHSNVRGSWAF